MPSAAYSGLPARRFSAESFGPLIFGGEHLEHTLTLASQALLLVKQALPRRLSFVQLLAACDLVLFILTLCTGGDLTVFDLL